MTKTKTPIETEGAPSPRTDFQIFWTGQELLVWGGFDELTGSRTNTGALYTPPPL